VSGRLRLLAECLRMVAAREGCTFASTDELMALHELGIVTVSGSRMDVDGHLFLLSLYEPGGNLCDAEPYYAYEVAP
jgi:hypothetical protein